MTIERLREISDGTQGVFTTAMAARAGLSSTTIGRLRRSGTIQRVAGHGMMLAGATPTLTQRGIATAMTWPDSAVCLRSAAVRHGLLPEDGDATDVLVPRARRPLAGIRPHFWSPRPMGIQRRDGYAVTDFRTTLADCLGRLPATEAWGMLAWNFTRDRITAEDVEAQLADRYHLYGVVRLREMAAALRRRAVSPPEVDLQVFLEDRRISGWTANARIWHGGHIVANADILFDEHWLILDYDGRLAHPPEQQRRDARRDELLRDLGYTVIRIRWERLTLLPHLLEAQIRLALTDRARGGTALAG